MYCVIPAKITIVMPYINWIVKMYLFWEDIALWGMQIGWVNTWKLLLRSGSFSPPGGKSDQYLECAVWCYHNNPHLQCQGHLIWWLLCLVCLGFYKNILVLPWEEVWQQSTLHPYLISWKICYIIALVSMTNNLWAMIQFVLGIISVNPWFYKWSDLGGW